MATKIIEMKKKNKNKYKIKADIAPKNIKSLFFLHSSTSSSSTF